MHAYFVGGGIGSLAGAAFMIRDAGVSGAQITLIEHSPLDGGSLDAAMHPAGGYSLRGGRMLTTDHDECLWDLLKTIPSIDHPRGVQFASGTTVTDMTVRDEAAQTWVEALQVQDAAGTRQIAVGADDLVLFQNASMTDASSTGTMTRPAPRLTKADSGGWKLWEKIAEGRPQFGRPATFNSSVSESYWASFTTTCTGSAFVDRMERFSGNRAGTGGANGGVSVAGREARGAARDPPRPLLDGDL